MKSIERVGMRPTSLALTADEIVEFHAARILLLLHYCGTSGKISGLTKLAKLDFFARYPDFFEVARLSDIQKEDITYIINEKNNSIESAMIRHHYGPWDKRYYHVLSYLESKQLINITKNKNSYIISLTKQGNIKSKLLTSKTSFNSIVERMKEIKIAFGGKNGSYIKNLIYKVFEKEVGRRSLGESIKS